MFLQNHVFLSHKKNCPIPFVVSTFRPICLFGGIQRALSATFSSPTAGQKAFLDPGWWPLAPQIHKWMFFSETRVSGKKNDFLSTHVYRCNILGRRGGGLAQKFLTLLHWAILPVRIKEARWLLGAGGLGWGGWMLTFHVTCSRCWCYATQGLGWVGGGDVNVPCDLLTLLMLRHAGVGVGGMLTFHVTCSRYWWYATHRHAGVGVGVGDVNVPCDLLTLLMLRHAGVGVGGMLTFHVTCSRYWWYATHRHAGVGVGWGGC